MSGNFDVVLIGLGPQGLALLRTFARNGYRVLALGRKNELGIHSKYGEIIVINVLSELDEVLFKVLSQDLQVHITGDYFLNYLLDNHRTIFDQYRVYPTRKSAEIFRDKIATGEMANSLGISYPEACHLSEVNTATYSTFPAVVKWHRVVDEQTGFKIFMINSRENLVSFLERTAFKEKLIIQRYVSGDMRDNLSYGGYWVEGKEIVSIIFRYLRQYPKGISSFSEQLDSPYATEMSRVAQLLLQKVSFSGFVEIEFKVDEKDGSLWLIEVNPRAWGCVKIFMDKFESSVLNVCKDRAIRTSQGRCWVNIVRDIRAILFLLKNIPSEFRFFEIVASYFRRPITDIFDLKDIKPFIMQFGKFFKVFQK